MSNPLLGRALNSTSLADFNGFKTVYREAFGGEPYFEQYTDDEIREIWDEHMALGRIILAKDPEAHGKVIGFGCSLPLHHAPQNVQDFLVGCMEEGLVPADFTLNNVWYMSELGVLEAYRGHGIAYKLVGARLTDVDHASLAVQIHGGKYYYVMRTAADKPSNSRHLYEQLGAVPIDRVHDVSDTDQVTQMGSQSVKRVYLFGESKEALHRLSRKGKGDESEVA